MLWLIALVLTGSVGVNQGINKAFTGARSDPYTGSQGEELNRRIGSMESVQNIMELRVDVISSIQHTMEFRMDEREDMCKETRKIIANHTHKGH